MHDDQERFSSDMSWEALIYQEHLTTDEAEAFQRYCFENNIDPTLSSLDMLDAMYREWRKDTSA